MLLKLTLNSLYARLLTVCMTVFAISLSLMLYMSVEKLRTSAYTSFTDTISQTDLIVGSRASSVQLLLYSVFRIGNATNNITWESYLDIIDRDEVDWAVPISLGDSHKGFRVMGTNKEFFNRQHLPADKIKLLLANQGWNEKSRLIHSGPAIQYDHPNHRGSVGIIAPYSKNFCDTCNRLRVTAQGQLHLCLFSEDGKDLRPYLQAGDSAQLTEFLSLSIYDKLPKHYLQQQQTGATRNFAMLGG